jgi:hypothetical protein
MSRDWDALCPECQKCHAIRGFITDGRDFSINLLQCRETGKFWVELERTKGLSNVEGKTEKDWKKAEQWVYKNLDNIMYSGEWNI